MSLKKNKQKFYKTRWIVVAFFITVIILGTILISRSRYVIKKNNIVQVSTDAIYFESSQLDDEETNYNDWNGKDNYSIDFNISNYIDSLRVSNSNIEYKITVQILEPENNNITTEIYINNEKKETGTLEKEKSQDDEVRIAIKNDGEKISKTLVVKVTAEATLPYKKIMTETYNISPESTEASKNEEYEINLEEKGDYENLLIKTNLYSGYLTINYDSSKLSIYQGYDALDDAEFSEGKVKLQLSNKKNYQIQFIKNNAQTNVTLGTDIKVQTGE